MYTKTPRLEIYPDRIAANARSVLQMCHAHGAPRGVRHQGAVRPSGCSTGTGGRGCGYAGGFPDPESAGNWRKPARHSPLLLRLPAVGSAEDAVLHAEYSLNSSLQTLAAISRAAGRLNKTHRAIVMVDVGDLREGVWRDRVVPLVTEAARLPNLEIAGLGANLACYGGVIPTRENMQILWNAGMPAARQPACRWT
jgi:D-serine deaminase-like pyridoxal phosphate-dependent protein